MADEQDAPVLLGGLRRLTRHDGSGLLAAKRRLATAVLTAEKYPL